MKINLIETKFTKEANSSLKDGLLLLTSPELDLFIEETIWKQLFGKFIKWCYEKDNTRFIHHLVNNTNHMKKDEFRYTTSLYYKSYVDNFKFFPINDQYYFYCHYSKFQVLENIKNVFKVLFPDQKLYLQIIDMDHYQVFNDKPIIYEEGGKVTHLTNHYERNLKARQTCINHYGYTCQVCEFDFKKRYGIIGKDFIEVHHIIPISQIEKKYVVNPIKDLIPVCSNCHQMLHKLLPSGNNPTVEQLKEMLYQNKV